MRRYNIDKVYAPRGHIPFWEPLGLLKWGGWMVLFLLLLLSYLLLFCLPKVPHDGDVQVLLEWETSDDVDLHVFDPAGEEIYYENPRSASGGELDIDANYEFIMRHPKENVYWRHGHAPSGTYKVFVKLYKQKEGVPIHYHVMAKYKEKEEHFSGTLLMEEQVDDVCAFVVE